ncbi:ribose-5-phosphate isomerase A [Ileibacterium valens]|uniref:ribose-5-phosphate isomerase n=1 Tax=Ileibacterium valens TaxID=1862668 RepID=A0A1U7NGI6_9FIRM|nr:ribose-5-phosphate isomerase A [Ileibacterium valens]OLU38054.1 hypothetical protein BM735_09800 [Erysipelotrichaceae bacterium NYU-BL-F16]OLU40234.1 hypothetical protein BO222_05455 [Ileibacterium valens]OLU43443.1 hypothetical protein BO224_00130 [Erysipelotrichaceae bacterium NYU-BL-E8]
MERHAAQAALAYIRDDMTIGLGSGKAVEYLIEFISMENYSNLKIVTNNMHTALLAKKRGLTIVPSWMNASLDYTFDTLDYLVKDLSGGMKNSEPVVQNKILASMAKQMIFMVSRDNFGVIEEEAIPFQVEVEKEALGYVNGRLKEMGAIVAEDSAEGRIPALSSNANYILSAKIRWNKDLASLNNELSDIPGIYATSLFTGLPVTALIYDKQGVETIHAF